MRRLHSTDRPGRSVRLRLTLLYGALFLASGAALLALTYVLVRESTGGVLVRATHSERGGTVERIESDSVPLLSQELGQLGREMRERAAQQRADTLEQLLVQSGVALGLMAVISIGLGWLMAGRVLRPLQAAFDAQRRFVANASHELRTPLTMMRTSLDVAAAKSGGTPQLRALDAKLREGLDRADRLLEGFLALARADHEALNDETSVSLPALAAAAIEQRAGAIAERGIQVHRTLGDAAARGSHALLARMVENVVDNAIRHNEPRGWVCVETRTEDGSARVVIESGGPRLREEDVRQLAQPFRRLGADRTGSDDGVGLGLSIVAAIAAAHDGELALHARPAGGLRVAIALPCAREPVPA